MACAYKDPVLYLRGLVLGHAFAVGLSMDFSGLPTAQRIGFGFTAGAAAFGGDHEQYPAEPVFCFHL